MMSVKRYPSEDVYQRQNVQLLCDRNIHKIYFILYYRAYFA